MLTLNTILKELKNVPLNRLEELYQLIHSLSEKSEPTEAIRKNILSFGGAFSDMSNNDYTDYLNHTKEARIQLFDRSIEL